MSTTKQGKKLKKKTAGSILPAGWDWNENLRWCDIAKTERGEFLLRNAPWILMWPVLALIIGILIWVGIGFQLEQERRELEADALDNVTSLSKTYAEYLGRTIERVDQLTLQLKYDWEKSNHAYRLEDSKKKGVFSFQYAAAITIVDKSGYPLTSTYPYRKSVRWNDSDAFLECKASATNVLRIEAPVTGKISGHGITRMGRCLADSHGNFDGMIIVSVLPNLFFSIASDPGLGTKGFQALVGREGDIRVARLSRTKPAVHEAIFRAPPPGRQAMLFAGPDWFTDGEPRYVASFPLAAYPLFAMVGIGQKEALAHYENNKITDRKAAILASLVLLMFAIVSSVLSFRLAWKTHRLASIRDTYRIATEGGDEGYYMWRAIRDQSSQLIDFEVIDCNESGAALFGTNRESLLNALLSDIEGVGPLFHSLMAQSRLAMETGFAEDDFEIRGPGANDVRWQRRRMVLAHGGLAVTLRDITREKAHEDELTRLANRDALTNLPNRYWLMKYLPIALKSAERSRKVVAILFIDLDNFKNVNDTLGHSAGDVLLKTIAARLQSALRPGDNVARLGGDEFTFILESVEKISHVSSIAKRILELFQEPVDIGGRKTMARASIGISIFPRDGEDSETLLKNADVAMYAAKAQGKSRFRFYDQELYARMSERIGKEQELGKAIAEDQFIMYYQPRVDAMSGKIVGMEALVRWMHPERGLVSPDEFIPVAECSGMILSLGALVMEKVFLQIVAWREQGLPLVPTSINVSARQFDEGGISSCIGSRLSYFGINPQLIEIELTESAMMGDFKRVHEEVEAINALGIRLHVDDFGTGYSSLSILHQFNMSVVKIDRTFTARVTDRCRGTAFFSAIVAMAKALKMRIVVEGVETHEQLCILRELGCNEIQGYLVSKPVPAHAIPELLIKETLIVIDRCDTFLLATPCG